MESGYKLLIFALSLLTFIVISIFIRVESFFIIFTFFIIIFIIAFAFWKIRGLIMLTFTITISLSFIFFYVNSIYFNIIMISIIYFIIESVHFLYEIKKSMMEMNLKIVKQKQNHFIDEIIKESQFRSTFVANLSHDLRSPLNSILGFTDLLIESLKSEVDEAYIEYLGNIYDSGQLLLTLINNLISIAKIDTGKLTLDIEEIDIEELILKIKHLLEPIFISKGLKCDYYPHYESQIIYADKLKLKQIILKLLSNTITYTKEGTIKLSILENEDNWEFIIQSMDYKIDEKELEFISDPYCKLNNLNIEKGNDIGFDLILAKRLIELHNGQIFIDTKPRLGTKYSFLIPKNL